MSISKPFEDGSLQNVTQLVKNNNNIISQPLMGDVRRPAPVLPPRPYSSGGPSNSYMSYGGKFLNLLYTFIQLFIMFTQSFISVTKKSKEGKNTNS